MERGRKPRSSSPEDETSFATGSNAPARLGRSLERALGRQIRQARRNLDLSVADLAAAAGISLGMLSKIENGQISPSLASLQRLASALAVPIASLFAAAEEQKDCSFVPSGRGVVIERRGSKAGHVYSLLGHVLGGDVAVEPYLITLNEGAAPYTGFQHAGTEFIYMLSGELVYVHAGQRYRLGAGDALLFDSSSTHGPAELVSLPCTYLSVIVFERSRA